MGVRGQEVGIEGAGSGDKGGGKRGSSTPLSTPLTSSQDRKTDFYVTLIV